MDPHTHIYPGASAQAVGRWQVPLTETYINLPQLTQRSGKNTECEAFVCAFVHVDVKEFLLGTHAPRQC